MLIGEKLLLDCESSYEGVKYRICELKGNVPILSEEVDECKKVCKEEGEWKSTPINSESYILCLTNQVGVITRNCNDDIESQEGKWSNTTNSLSCVPNLNSIQVIENEILISFTITLKGSEKAINRSMLTILYGIIAQALNMKVSNLYMVSTNNKIDAKMLYYSDITSEELKEYLSEDYILDQINLIEGLSKVSLEIEGFSTSSYKKKESKMGSNEYITIGAVVSLGLSIIIIGLIYYVKKKESVKSRKITVASRK